MELILMLVQVLAFIAAYKLLMKNESRSDVEDYKQTLSDSDKLAVILEKLRGEINYRMLELKTNEFHILNNDNISKEIRQYGLPGNKLVVASFYIEGPLKFRELPSGFKADMENALSLGMFRGEVSKFVLAGRDLNKGECLKVVCMAGKVEQGKGTLISDDPLEWIYYLTSSSP